jgi:hypothetical protein
VKQSQSNEPMQDPTQMINDVLKHLETQILTATIDHLLSQGNLNDGQKAKLQKLLQYKNKIRGTDPGIL